MHWNLSVPLHSKLTSVFHSRDHGCIRSTLQLGAALVPCCLWRFYKSAAVSTRISKKQRLIASSSQLNILQLKKIVVSGGQRCFFLTRFFSLLTFTGNVFVPPGVRLGGCHDQQCLLTCAQLQWKEAHACLWIARQSSQQHCDFQSGGAPRLAKDGWLAGNLLSSHHLLYCTGTRLACHNGTILCVVSSDPRFVYVTQRAQRVSLI